MQVLARPQQTCKYRGRPASSAVLAAFCGTNYVVLISDEGACRHLVSVQAHPVLGTPFFGLHPCRTANLMALVLPTGGSPMETEASGMAAAAAASGGPVDEVGQYISVRC